MGLPVLLQVQAAAKYRGFTHPKSSDGESINVLNPKYNPTFWNEPHPQGQKHQNLHIHNHVRETESVMFLRLMIPAKRKNTWIPYVRHKNNRWHKSNQNYWRWIWDWFESKYLYVKGDFNITVEGDYNLNVKGNKYEHIWLLYYCQVISKIMGNEEVDTQSNMNIHVSKIETCRLVLLMMIDHQWVMMVQCLVN